MSNSYDYLAVADDSELIDAQTKQLIKAKEEGNEELALRLAVVTPWYDLAKTIKTLCYQNPDIFKLVNNQIEETRTAECIERQKHTTLFTF